MEKVTGIGGLFFRAKDPQILAKWYSDNLGITLTPKSYEEEPWRQEAGVTIFGPFPENTEYFGDQSKQWMVNFRVGNLDAMAAQLRGDRGESRFGLVSQQPLRSFEGPRRQPH